MKKFILPKRLRGIKPNVWTEYNDLEMKFRPLNLGHGFPDYAPPSYVAEALRSAAVNADPLVQQYARISGHLPLVQAISKLFSGLIDRPIDPRNEVLITVGAYEAIFSSIMGHIDQGDEVILIEPFFDSYEPLVKMAGGRPRYIPLRSNKSSDVLTSAEYCLFDQELESVFNEKTKMIIINTPHNPLGKVYRREELEKIAQLCRKWNVLCVSDEVYEWIVFDGNVHSRICTLPGMWERTITIGSAGKTFFATGWKIGWAYGPSNLLENLRLIHRNCTNTCPTPLQEALSFCFEHETKILNSPESFFKRSAKDLQSKRDFMVKLLTEAGLRPIVPEGGYFILADWSSLADKIDLSQEADECADYRFTKWLIKNVGLESIPPSVFYSDANKHLGEQYVRFCFVKNPESLKKAAEILRNWKL